jgi:hypothetical protein
MVVNGTRMYFTGTNGYSATAQNGQGCALFRTSELFQPNGVAFLLLSDTGSDADLMDFLFNNPAVAREWQSYSYRADVPVGGGRYVRLIELNINDDYTVYDYPSNNAARQPMLIIDPNASNAANGNRRFSLAVADANSRPVLHHMESSTLSGWSWRKVFSLFSASSLAGAGTYLRFSYLDPSELNVNLAAGSGSRPTVMNVLGGGGNGTLTTPGASTWNLTATFVDTRLTLAPGGALNIVGGLRVNRNTTVSTNSVNFLWNTNVSNPPLDVFADRVGWVETWQQ